MSGISPGDDGDVMMVIIMMMIMISPGGLPRGEGGLAEGDIMIERMVMVISNVSRWSEIPAASGVPGPRTVRLKLVGESHVLSVLSVIRFSVSGALRRCPGGRVSLSRGHCVVTAPGLTPSHRPWSWSSAR